MCGDLNRPDFCRTCGHDVAEHYDPASRCQCCRMSEEEAELGEDYGPQEEPETLSADYWEPTEG